MATLTVQDVLETGTTPTYASAASGGDQYSNASGQTFLIVRNGGGGSIDVTVNSQTNCSQGFDHDLVVAVAAGSEKWIKTKDKNRYNDSSGFVQVTYSGVTSVTVAAINNP